MINWKDIGELHVISRLEEIISKWFGVELFYTDEHYKIQSHLLDKDYECDNGFLHIQLKMPHGYEILGNDIEKATDDIKNKPEKSMIFDSHWPGVRGVVSKIMIDGDFSGCVFAYPFVRDGITQNELDALKKELVKVGAKEEDVGPAIDQLTRLFPRQKETLCDLIDFAADEIETFHEEIAKREERILQLNSEVGSKYRYHNLIGKSKKMQLVYRLLEKISSSESTILIQGDNGTGKELVAKAIHYNSPRKNNVFVAVNCAAFNDNLLDSELFGHVKGAFTGAVKDKKGFFETANGGTLFLDEIGDTSLSMQVKLLRVLQEGTFLPVGATSPRRVDVRVVCATNKPLREMLQTGEFREDLYYRINVINIALPGLKERKEDIPLLGEFFLEKECAEAGIPTKTFSKKCLEKMLNFSWPGNVRQLENEIERMVVLAGEEKVITPELLSPQITEALGGSAPHRGIKTSGTLKEALEELESYMIREGLKRCNFNKSRLAKELGISRAGLIMKVDKYGLDKRKKAAGE